MLALALQVLPFSRAFVALTPAGGSSFAIISTWIAGALALLGSVDAVSGASTVITSPTTATATNGVPFSYRITTGPQAANTFDAAPLPAGLTVGKTTGRITGTPTVDGVFVILLTASDGGKPDRTLKTNLTLTIFPPGNGGGTTAPSITTQPQSRTVTNGGSTTLNVVAAGTAPLSYRWRLNGNPLPGATNSSLTLNGITTNQAGGYAVVVTNTAGSVTSAVATLTVLAPPVITTQPQSLSVLEGANVTFSVAAGGTAPLGYQWRRNGVNLSAATSATLSLIAVTTNQAGVYTCLVTNLAGSATSSAATLTVELAPVAPTITTQPQNQSVSVGADVTFTVVAGGTAPLSYQWRFNGANLAGATSTTLTLTAVTTNQAGDYTCFVANSVGSVTSAGATLTVQPAVANQPPVISTVPNQTTTEGTIVGPIPFTISDVETPASGLALNATSTNPSLVPASSITFSGGGNNRTMTIAPYPGRNGLTEITIFVGDGQASSFTTFTLDVVAAAPTQLILRTNGNGIISPNLNGQSLLPGRAYYLTALAGPGHLFTGWSGSTNSTTSRLAFVMSSNLTFQANFVPVRVSVNGTGTLSPDPRKTPNLLLGRVYTLRALPGAGHEFAGWSGSFQSSSPYVSVVLTTNLHLEANFIPSPFIPIAGTYRGLFHEETEVRPYTSGYFTIVVSPRGTYSGSLQTALARHSFTGKLGLDCRGHNPITRRGNGPLNLALSYDSTGESDVVWGQVSDTNWTATLRGDRLVFNPRSNPSPQAGTYTIILPGGARNVSLPEGAGFGVLRVAASGLTLFTGTMGDGARVVQSSGTSKDGRWPLHSVLAYGSARGAVMGWMNFADRPTDDLNGTLIWTKPPNPLERFYPAGFVIESQAVGSSYRPPVGPQTNYILKLEDADVTFTGGNLLADFSNAILLGPYSRVSNLSGNSLRLNFSTSLGTFTGSVTDPTSLKPFSFKGAVLQKQNAGYGFLTGTNRTSRVEIKSSE
jgi:hypothetical protein